MGDAFADQLDKSLTNLRQDGSIRDKITVDKDHSFVGFDAYKQVLASGVDVVLLATPPQFRPLHLAAAVAAGKHIFAEKPVAVDAVGVKSVLASCEAAKQKKLSVVSGLCLRYQDGFRETIQRIHDGAIGDVVALQANDLRGPIWVKPRQPAWSDMEWQMRNWYYFTWLSGDFNVEQHIHFLDSMRVGDQRGVSRAGDRPRRPAGPRRARVRQHLRSSYRRLRIRRRRRCFSQCRQQANCHSDMSVQSSGPRERPTSTNAARRSAGEKPWQFRGKDNDIYQDEHNDLFASIRSGKPINHGAYMANSTLMAIMGRMATYTGQAIQWRQARDSREDLTPSKYEWSDLPTPPVAIPGITPFV